MTKILVCRVGKEPQVEDVEDVFKFGKEMLDDAFIETQTIVVGEEIVRAFWAENHGNLKFNRLVPSRCPYIPENIDFIIDTRVGPPEGYAEPGEMGYFDTFGDFLLTRIVDGEHADISEQGLKTFAALLALPKCKRCKKNTLAYPGAVYCGAGCSARAEAGE